MFRFFTTLTYIVLIVSLSAVQATGEKQKWRVVWSWQEENHEIYRPTFSPVSDEIAFVRKFHIADGHEAELTSKKKLAEYQKRIETDKRFADPEIVVTHLGNNRLERLDWGWSPSFSPDGINVAYAHQKKPISGFRVLASTLEGNEIRIYNLSTKITSTLAVPDSAFFSDPIFSPDGDCVLYFISDAVNGAFPGDVGVGSVTVTSKENKLLYAPTREHGLYQIIYLKQFIGEKVMVIRMRPDGPGDYLAESYTYELLELGSPHRIIYGWGTHSSDTPKMRIGINPDGELMVFDYGWLTLKDKDTSPEQRYANLSDDPGHVSPNWQYVARLGPGSVTIWSRKDNRKIFSWITKSRVQELSWSPDSNWIAIVVTKYKDKYQDIFLSDELVILGHL
jgi:hypothetical protein